MKVVTFETTDGKERYLLVDTGGVPIEEARLFLRFEDNRGLARNTLKQKCIHLKHFYTFYIRDHHEPIVSREVWDEAERIRMKRSKNCPHCKAIDEAILEGAFLEAFGLLAGNFDDVLDLVMSNVEEALNNAEDVRKKQQLDKDISSLESKKSRMTDMLIDGTISKEVYDEKVLEFTRKLHTLSERRYLLEESINKQKDVGKRMSALRETLSSEQVLDEFDRVVFESIIEKVLVGGFDEE